MPLEDIQSLVYELQVHQVELEMQNEELRLTQEETRKVAHLASFPQLCPSPILEIDGTGAITFYNEAALKTVRKLGLEDLRSLLPGGLDETLPAIRQKGDKGLCLEIEKQNVIFMVHAHYTPQWQAVRLYYTDITERKRAKRALQESERRLRAIFEQAAVGVAQVETATGRFIEVNQKFCEIVGLSPEEMTATNFMAITLPEDLEVDLQYLQKLLNGQIRTFSREKRYLLRDGSIVWVNLTVSPMWNAGEAPNYHIAVVEDITERKQVENNLRLEKLFSDMAIESLPGLFYLFDDQGSLLRWNRNFEEVSGYPAAELAGMKPQDFFLGQEKPLIQAAVQEVFLKGESSVEADFIAKDGSKTPYFFTGKRAVLGGKPCLLGMGIDITARQQAEETLKSLIATAPIGIYIIQKGKFVLINPGFEAITGYRSSELLGKDSLTLVTSEYRALVKKQALRALRKEDSSPYEYQFTSKSGETGWVMETIISTRYEGKRAVLGYFMDITSHKKLEKQFLQAQRMEAVGRLAGGLAHDFSNVLAVIIIYVETMLKEVREGDPLGLHIKGVKEAAHRAISLTRELMALGRRQLLQPRAIKVNALVRDMAEMLGRLLDEDVELVLTLDPGEIVAKVDPSQLEQVLLNLVVNARDAMPQGGRLTIATDEIFLGKSAVSQHVDVAPGRYVMLAVSDTGIGMDQETQAHILEPFYTTKPSSEGSGLGLSTVYGIVKQSGGFVEVWSELGNGATFKIFLPAIQETLEPPAPIPESRLLQGSETILLVEDVDDLRKLVQDVLKNYGYTVLTASHGSEALEIGERHRGPIHLLLLDVVLPQMSGAQIAERLKSSYPGTRVLYMSGYPEDAIIHRKLLDGTAAFIQKPFAPTALLAKVRELLDSAKRTKTPSRTEI
jgi:PAS domain S-box-containing protein